MWVVWYADGTSFSSIDGDPWCAPRSGVQCVAVASQECGNYILSQQDYYCWHFDEGVWIPHDFMGMVQYLDLPGREKVVLRGFWIGREAFMAIRTIASRDSRLPQKTATVAEEEF